MRALAMDYDGDFDDDMKELMGRIAENRKKAPVYTMPTLSNFKEEELDGDMILVEFDQDGYVIWASCNDGLSEEQDGPWPGPVKGNVQI
jgi:hypothetical protein